MPIKTRKSDPSKPPRVMIYGVEGVGKSTLGAMAEKPIFITPEGGADQLKDSKGNPIEEFENVRDWDSLERAVAQLTNEEHGFKTLVLDSADWIEGLAHKKIIGNSGKDIIRCNGGYGSGYRDSQRMHTALISDLSRLRSEKGMNIIVTAHSHVKPVKDPDATEDYDCHEIKCHEMVSSLWREWVDALLFARFRAHITSGEPGKKARAFGDGTRVVYTIKSPAFQAKNRYGMEPEYEFTLDFWNTILKFSKKGVVEESAESLLKEIGDAKALIKDEKLFQTISESVSKAKVDPKKLKPILNRLREITGAMQ